MESSKMESSEIESSEIKVCKMQVRKVAQDILMFVWYKQGVIPEKPTPELSFVPEIAAEFLNDLCVLVWIDSYENEYVWKDFFENHFERIIRTPFRFANYFAYASYILIENATNAHACFIDILSLVTHFALHCWQKDDRFLNSCVDLFCAFFDKEICKMFEDQGRWKNFNEYIQNQGNLIRHKELIRANKPPNEIFKEIQSKHQEFKEPYIINGVVLKDVTENEVENHEKAESFANLVKDQMKEVCTKTLEEVLKGFPKTDNQVEELYRETIGVASGGIAYDEDQASLQEVQEDALENVPSKANPMKDEDQSKELKRQKAFKEILKDSPKTDGQEKDLHQETVEVASIKIASDENRPSSQEVQKDALENIFSKTSLKEIEDRTKDKDSGLLVAPVTGSLKSRDSNPAHQESDPSSKLEKTEKAKELLQVMLKDIEKIGELIKFVCE